MSEGGFHFTNDGAVRGWYLAAASGALKAGGRPVAVAVGGVKMVLYRGEAGRVYAMAAACPHMGANLAAGTVVGERLRCAMHHRLFSGECGEDVGCGAGYPVAERYGAVFVFNAREAGFPAPAFAETEEGELRTLAGRAISIDCPWHAVVSNGYDLEHFGTVHRRRLREEPVLERIGDHGLRLRYVSGVTGRSPADLAMKWLAHDRIGVAITCWGGPVMLVESDLGRTRSALILGVQPVSGRAEVMPLFCVYRSGARAWDRVRLRAARWLFQAFLRRDLEFLDGMAFRPPEGPADDPVHHTALTFLAGLPLAGEGAEARMVSAERA